ncbi:FAD-dependent monooxygenase [Arthrobacter sp. H41]|uniref:FAD-dependent monooxygenase n=1 Tax=Arthrobacter sp. H41 TaxID=1312978 RepID=UPI0004796859|nr:FAD-dependent monooxygenase [Arthrobacter sp. H41]
MDTPHRTTDVLVVGAGPTGLMLANWLRKLGVDAVLIDGKAGPTRESRAIGVQSRTLEIFDQLGLADRVLERAQHAGLVRQGYGKRSYAPVPLGELGRGLTPFPGLYFLEQSRNEEILSSNLVAVGGEVLWGTRLVGLEDTGTVSASVEGPEGPSVIEARYCVACDGGSSEVRRLKGIPFEGVTNEYTFYVLDALAVGGLPDASVNIRQGATDFLLAFPMKSSPGSDDAFRLIGVVPTTGDADVPEEVAQARLSSVFGVTYGTSRWFSTYRVHHRLAARFRDGAVFLAGDAGHLHSPVGAQGMNTGLQDAHNLAFKLADVLRHAAPEEYLDRYDAERRPVARRLVRSTDRVFGYLTSNALPARLTRRLVPRLVLPVVVRVLPHLPLAGRLAGYLGQLRIHYWMSSRAKAAARGRRGRVVGRRLPWTGTNFDVLRDAVWQVHIYGGMDDPVADAVGRSLDLPVHRFPAAPGKGLQDGFFYLVRPDGFVASAAPAHSAVSELRGALPTAL